MKAIKEEAATVCVARLDKPFANHIQIEGNQVLQLDLSGMSCLRIAADIL